MFCLVNENKWFVAQNQIVESTISSCCRDQENHSWSAKIGGRKITVIKILIIAKTPVAMNMNWEKYFLRKPVSSNCIKLLFTINTPWEATCKNCWKTAWTLSQPSESANYLLTLFTRNVPYKHTTCIPRWNDVEMTVSMSFQRGIHMVCL